VRPSMGRLPFGHRGQKDLGTGDLVIAASECTQSLTYL